MTLNIYQIYFNQKTKGEIIPHPCVFGYDNTAKNTVYFENRVIAELISEGKHLDSDYFAVWSWQFLKTPAKGKALNFSIDRLIHGLDKKRPDVLSFFSDIRNGGVIFHNQTRLHYASIFNPLMEFLGLKFREANKPKYVVMQNHFVSRSDIYEHYVKLILIPAIDWLSKCDAANKYTPYKRGTVTYHTFICERLFNAYLHDYGKKYKCLLWEELYN